MNTCYKNTKISKIALFTIAVGKDSYYFESIRRYLPYNKKYFGQDYPVDYLLFTDRVETIEGVVIIPCETSVWPYTTLLRNNIIVDYLNQENKWLEYSHAFFIDADFAINDTYDFFSHKFLCIKAYWTGKNMGGFYGGRIEYFKN
jgi:hypothetical protein